MSEFAIAETYVSPFFIYACVTLPIYITVRALLARSGLLRWVWHTALFEFAVSLMLLAALILYV